MRVIPLLLAIVALVLAPAPSRAAWPTTAAAPLFLSTPGGGQTEIATLSDGAGVIYVAWTDSRDGQKIRLQRYTSAGNVTSGWPADGLRVSASPGTQRGPALALDEAGGVYVAWEEPGPAGDWNVWIERVSPAGTTVTGWPAAGLPLCLATRHQVGLRLLADGAGGCTATWYDERSSKDFTFLYAVRITSQGARVTGWPPNGRPVVLTAGATSPSGLAADGTGGFFVTYVNTDSTVHVQRIGGLGTYAPGWPVNDGLLLGTHYVPGSAIVTVPDGSGGVFSAWTDVDGDANVKITHINGDSSIPPGWSPDGVSASSQVGDQTLRGGVSDAQGGVILAWDDLRNASTKKSDIYGVRFTGTGYIAGGWTPEGSPLDVSTSDDRDATIVSDGAGGAIVVYRSGNFTTGSLTLVAQRIAVDGTRPFGWAAGGNDIGVVAGRDAVPSVVYDGLSGAVAAWSFENTGSPQARVTRVDRSGKIGLPTEPTTSSPETPARLWLAPPTPNPCRLGANVTFTLARDQAATLEVVDAAGRRVARLWNGEAAAGAHRLWWDASDAGGRRLPAGLYFLTLRTPEARLVRRVIVAP